MEKLLQEDRFSFLTTEHKQFIVSFDTEMKNLGYNFGGKIGDGFCWGKYMVIYRKSGVKSTTVYARIYMKTDGIILRLFLNNVSKHSDFIRRSPAHIRDAFMGDFGKCNHEHDKNGICKFRKAYTIEGTLIEKCNGHTFWFFDPTLDKLTDYKDLFLEFYPKRN